MFSSLPPEIINAIILEFSGDFESLEACSRVSSYFCDISQQLLFKTLTIDLKPYPSIQYTNLQDIFSDNTRPGLCVRVLRLKVSPETATDVLYYMQHLRSISIEPHDSATPWSSMSEKLRAALITLLSLPTLVQLKIATESQIPLIFLRQCPQLKDLQIMDQLPDHTLGNCPQSCPNFSRPTYGYFESLTAQSCDVCEEVLKGLTDRDPASRLSVNQLRRFNGEILDSRSVDVFQKFINLCAGFLEIINIVILFGMPES
ncbi:hypothetical protein H0H81_008467 [Sphagnurus paluster]|uniref:F-box domain-containing protein n=1 Tax=Sphagnurus paluster TaxID=117069 RepID=A0A9P7KK91_9AGAR|nr:hypothetical protein H0H81_008467 [Sphagnurus paluster]